MEAPYHDEKDHVLWAMPGLQFDYTAKRIVEYQGKQFVKETGLRIGIVEQEQLQDLIGDFHKSGFLSMKESYEDQGITDMPTVILSFSENGTTHRVIHYHGDKNAPKQLFDLEKKVDKAANSRQWINRDGKK